MGSKLHAPAETEQASTGAFEGAEVATDFGDNSDQQAAMGASAADRVVGMLEDGIPDWNAFCAAVDTLPDAEWQTLMKNPAWEAAYDEAERRNSGGEAEEAEEPEVEPAAPGAEVAGEAAADAPALKARPEGANPSGEAVFGADAWVLAALTTAQAQAASGLVSEIESYVEKYIGDAEAYDQDGTLPDARSLERDFLFGDATPSLSTKTALGLDEDTLISVAGHRTGLIDPRGIEPGYLWNELRGSADTSITFLVHPEGRADPEWARTQEFDLTWSATSAIGGGAPDVEVTSRKR